MTPLTVTELNDRVAIEQAVLESLRGEWRRSVQKRFLRAVPPVHVAGACSCLLLGLSPESSYGYAVCLTVILLLNTAVWIRPPAYLEPEAPPGPTESVWVLFFKTVPSTLLLLTLVGGGLVVATTWPSLWQHARSPLSPRAHQLAGEVLGSLFGYNVGLLVMAVAVYLIARPWRRRTALVGAQWPSPSASDAFSGTPELFELDLDVDDVGHTLVVGPARSGMSTFLAPVTEQTSCAQPSAPSSRPHSLDTPLGATERKAP